MGNDWFHEYFINELKAIGRKPTSNMQHEVVDSLPSSGNEQTIYFVKNDSSSTNDYYDEYVWISSSSTFEKIGSTQIDGAAANPDWNQNDATQQDYIKNRPFYSETTETVLVEESTVSFSAVDGGYMGQLESTFSATVGETYKVSWDGTVYESTCAYFSGVTAIGNRSIVGAGSDTGEPFIMNIINGQIIIIITTDTAASHTFSISVLVTQIGKIDEKYLPDTVATKSDVEATHEALDGMFSSVATFTFDKQTSGRDTFNFNAFDYYKISDFNPAPDDVISFTGTRESGDNYSEITTGSNCVGYGLFIVVSSAGDCSLPITETVQGSFAAPSAGLYAQYNVDTPYQTAGTGEFTLRASTGSSYITGLLLKSSTADSTKKFKITVDDNRSLKVVNTSNSSEVTMAKTSDIPTDVHINELINTALSAIGVAEEGAY